MDGSYDMRMLVLKVLGAANVLSSVGALWQSPPMRSWAVGLAAIGATEVAVSQPTVRPHDRRVVCGSIMVLNGVFVTTTAVLKRGDLRLRQRAAWVMPVAEMALLMWAGDVLGGWQGGGRGPS